MPYTSGLFELSYLDITGTDGASPVATGLADSLSFKAASPVATALANSLSFNAASPVATAEADFTSLRLSQDITFGQDTQVEGIINIPIGNAVAFGQQVSVELQLLREAAQSIAFTQLASNVIQIDVIQNITFGSFAFYPQLSALLGNTIAIGQSAVATFVLERAFQNAIVFEQRAKKGTEETTDNTITLANEAARGATGENSLVFTDATTVDLGKPGTSPVGFGQILGVTKTLNINVGNGFTLFDNAIGYVEQDCDDGKYSPIGSGLPAITFTCPGQITLVCGADSITLRNPNFGNTDQVELRRAFNTVRGGLAKASRDATNPKPVRLTIEVDLFSLAKRTELLDFLENCLAQQVTYTDNVGRVRTGVIINPETALSTELDGSCGRFTASIEMVVDP